MYPGRESNPQELYSSTDFKSVVSTNSTTWAKVPLTGFEPVAHSLEGCCSIHLSYRGVVSGWQDSNLRLPGPKPGALTGLRYTPKNGGGSGLRTPGTFRYVGFQDQCIRPLCQTSIFKEQHKKTGFFWNPVFCVFYFFLHTNRITHKWSCA